MNYTFCLLKNKLRTRPLVAVMMILAMTTICAQNANAVVDWKNLGVYYENFDSLTNVTGIDSVWLDELTLADWYTNKIFIRADHGSISSPTKMNSYGSLGSTDRALGSHINSAVPTSTLIGIKLQNNSAAALNEFTVRYTGEQWRAKIHSGTSAEKLRFSYAIGNALVGINLGVYVNEPNLDFISPNLTNVGGVNGNLDENSETLTYRVTGIHWEKGDYLMLRWEDFTEKTGADNDGLAIDDFYFTTSVDLDQFTVSHTGINFESVPEPSTIGLFGITAVGVLIAAKRRMKRAA